jgi:hypothetical protein
MRENLIKACIYVNKIDEQYCCRDGLMMEAIGNITVNKERDSNDRNAKTVAVHALKTMVMQQTLHLKRSTVQQTQLAKDLGVCLFWGSKLLNETRAAFRKSIFLCLYCVHCLKVLQIFLPLYTPFYQECDNKATVFHRSEASTS